MKVNFLKSIFWHEGVKIRQSRGLVFFSEGLKDFKNQKKSPKIDKKLNRVPPPKLKFFRDIRKEFDPIY